MPQTKYDYMRTLADAYLAAHPADDDAPADREWMESMGWHYLDVGCWGYKTRDGYIANGEGEYWYAGLQLNTGCRSLQIVADGGRESVEMECPCRTRGDIRRIHAVFGVKAD